VKGDTLRLRRNPRTLVLTSTLGAFMSITQDDNDMPSDSPVAQNDVPGTPPVLNAAVETNAKPKKPISIFVSIPYDQISDDVYKHGIETIATQVTDNDLTINRADRRAYEDHRLEKNIFNNIDNSDLIIGDISHAPDSQTPNPNVMHEIGYATGRGIPIILVGRDASTRLPANIRGRLVVKQDRKDHEFKQFSADLAKQVLSTIKVHSLPRFKGGILLRVSLGATRPK
jgi:nucleoside 2-deoxyribosyltransferase